MRCTVCGAYGSVEDNFCRRCGAVQGNSRLPVKRAAQLPVPWRRTAPVLAQGVALVAVGVVAEWVLSSLARGAFRLPLSLLEPRKRSQSKALAQKRKSSLPEGEVAISETLVMRRVILRR